MIEVFDCIQGESEWWDLHKGLPTASYFATVMAKGKTKNEPSKTRTKYLRQLAGEIVSDVCREEFTNKTLERGKEMEEPLRNMYSMMTDQDVQRVGFIRNGRKGCSPDGLVASKGMVEIKSMSPHLLIGRILGELPPEHYAQLQGNLWVAEREWIDLMTGYTGMPPVIRKFHRDEAYIKNLEAEVNRFLAELDDIVAKVRAYR